MKQENLDKIRRRVDQAKIKFIEGSAPREGKKLLVLDIDYTLFDHRSTAERPEELRRPFLLEFLSLSYQFYDIVIWSATSMKWIEVKMKELGVMDESREFKILAFVDYTAMISVTTDKVSPVTPTPLSGSPNRALLSNRSHAFSQVCTRLTTSVTPFLSFVLYPRGCAGTVWND